MAVDAEDTVSTEDAEVNGWRTAVVRSFAEWRKVVFGEGEE